ncbi:hypothetical protein T439DRAFT_360176 [Meredithblackwellia eburnea MCA 4105]
MKFVKIAKRLSRAIARRDELVEQIKSSENRFSTPYRPLQELTAAIQTYISEAENTIDSLWKLKNISEEDAGNNTSVDLIRDFGRDAVRIMSRLDTYVFVRAFEGVTLLKSFGQQNKNKKEEWLLKYHHGQFFNLWAELFAVDTQWREVHLAFQGVWENKIRPVTLGSARGKEAEGVYHQLKRSSDEVSLQLFTAKDLWMTVILELYPQGPNGEVKISFVNEEEWERAKYNVTESFQQFEILLREVERKWLLLRNHGYRGF